MGATADTIWRVPAYLPYLQPSLTDEAVASAEKALGCRLPSEYLTLLRKQNGGYLRYELPENVHNTIAGIGPFFPSLTRFDWDEAQAYVGFPLEGLIPFDGDGHWHLCLDYRKNQQAPAITLADIECDEELPIASSFADYLDMLQIRVDDEYVLEAVADIENVKAGLSVQLGVQFEPPDTWAHGYPTYRARLGADQSQNPEWVWISPNTVPRGFVRKDDPRYSELKDLMPGFADRFPELPANSYILSASDGGRAKVLDACRRSGLVSLPLREYYRRTKEGHTGPKYQ